MFAQTQSDVWSETGCIFLGLLSEPPNSGHSGIKMSATLINTKNSLQIKLTGKPPPPCKTTN